MGRRIQRILEDAPDDEMYLAQVKDFSDNLEKASLDALQATVDRLVNNIKIEQLINQDKVGHIAHPALPGLQIWLERDDRTGRLYLPFRPIVFGGDDTTFVCDGRIGLSLAQIYLEEFERQTQRLLPGGKATASAGVAIVKVHYPFARAYDLAEELAGCAKRYRIQLTQHHHDWNDGCLDWHFALSGLSGSLEDIRRREYQTHDGNLELRPVTVHENPDQDFRSWAIVRSGIHSFQEDKAWSNKHNKTKALRDVLRQGPVEVEKFGKRFGAVLPELETATGGKLDYFAVYGWRGNTSQGEGWCGYFDALDLADLFIPLER